MCNYCQGEGCFCGNPEEGREVEPCQNLTLGSSGCASCGCTPTPWWDGVELPGDNGEVRDLLYDLYSEEGTNSLTKAQILQMGSSNAGAVNYLETNLPEKVYNGTSDIVVALMSRAKPMAWERKPTDMIWKYPVGGIPPGQKLVVGTDQRSVLMSVDGKACDEYGPGEHTISRANCPKLASRSRKLSPGFKYDVLDGFPVFVSPEMEFEIDLSEVGQTKTLRRVMMQGVARVSVALPGIFAERLGTNSSYTSNGVISALKKYCSDAVKKEMVLHEMEELKSSPRLLQDAIEAELGKAGLRVVKVNLTYVGEIGPGAFGIPNMGQSGNRQSAEQMKQWAESMQVQQKEMMQKVQEMQKLRATTLSAGQAQSSGRVILCTSCNTSNPPTSKFCGGCGKPLPVARVCSNCGQEVEAGIKFCGNCGTKIE